MAERDLNFSPSVTDVVTEQPDSLAVGIAAIGAKIADTAEQSKLLQNTAQAHVAFKGLDAQFRLKYAGDPSNAEGLKELQEQRQQVISGLGDNISTFYQRQWTDKTTELAGQSDISNDLWATHQNRLNTVSNVNTTAKTYTDQANQDGRAFGISDATDFSPAMNYLQARQNLEQFGNANIGAEKTGALLKNFNSDYVKSFVSGVAESSPEKATQLLDSPDIQAHFTTAERGDMVDQIARVKRQQQLQKDLSVTVNNGQVTDLVNDTGSTYYEKRAQIDKWELDGSISPTIAAKSRRVIKSTSDLDTQTDTPVMAGIINQVYDLNANAGTGGGDYLRGVQNLQGHILEMQADGKLTAPDANKLMKQVSNLTSQRLSSATQQAGNDFYEANQTFQQLPPEYRGEATRQLFYQMDGKTLNKDQQKQMALQVADQINQKRRKSALDVVGKTTQSDAEFLTSIKASPADVAATAAKYHMTEAQVLAHLRQHAAKGNKVKGVNGGGSADSPEAAIEPTKAPIADQEDATDDAAETGEE